MICKISKTKVQNNNLKTCLDLILALCKKKTKKKLAFRILNINAFIDF